MPRIDELDAEQQAFFLEMLKRARDGGQSQTELGDAVGVSQQQISRLETGELRPTVNMARRLGLAGYLRIQPFLDRDFEGADPFKPPPATISASDAARLREALSVVQDVLSRLP